MKGNRNRKVRLGLIGCGNVAENRHLPALQSLKNAKVVAVADTQPDRLKRVASKFHIEKSHMDYRVLLIDPEVEAVAVCVPPHSHVKIGLAALDAGKHLFLEKPLALSLDECNRLIERAKGSPLKTMVGFNQRWHRLIRQARRLIEEGRLGPLNLVNSIVTSRVHGNEPEWLRRRELGGGVLIEYAVHTFDLWRFLFQSDIEKVFALSSSGEWEDETATVTAQMANGMLAMAAFSKGTAENNTMEIYGKKGGLHISRYRFDGLQYFPPSRIPGGLRTRLHSLVHTFKELPQATAMIGQGGDFVASYQAQWRHFLQAIQKDTPVECTLDDGRRALQIALAAIASTSLGRSIEVSQAPRKIIPVNQYFRGSEPPCP